MKNSKLNMYSLFVEYSWQTQCGDTPKYPILVHWALFCLRIRSLEPGTLLCFSFYIPLILMSHATTYITNTSPLHHCMMLWWCHALFGRKPTCMCPNMWAEIPHSEHVHLCDHAQPTSMGSVIPAPGAHHGTIPQVPQHILMLSLPGQQFIKIISLTIF